MLIGHTPWHNEGTTDIFFHVLTKQPEFPTQISREAQDLILRLMDKDPGTRLGSNGIEEVKAHPFFRNRVKWTTAALLGMTPPWNPEQLYATEYVDERNESFRSQAKTIEQNFRPCEYGASNIHTHVVYSRLFSTSNTRKFTKANHRKNIC